MHAGLQSGSQLIDCVTASVFALVPAVVVAHRMVLLVLSTTCTDPSPDSAVPAEYYWRCPVRAGTVSVSSISILIPATLAEWLCLPAPVRAP